MIFYERLEKLLADTNITRKEMCDMANINYSSLSTSINRNSPAMTISTIQAIAKFFNVSADYLLGISNDEGKYRYDKLTDSLITEFQKLNDVGKNKALSYVVDIQNTYPKIVQNDFDDETEEKRMLPLYDYPASAGSGIYCGEGEYELVEVPDKAPASTSFGVLISGESMQPDIPDGSIVWVRQQPSVDIGQVCIVVINDEGYCKRLGVNEFESINREYKNIRPSESDEVRISGLVVYIQPPEEQ